MAAAFITVMTFALETYGEVKQIRGEIYDEDRKNRIKIAIEYLNIASELSWFTVQCIMLKIFAKYGQPMKESDQLVI